MMLPFYFFQKKYFSLRVLRLEYSYSNSSKNEPFGNIRARLCNPAKNKPELAQTAQFPLYNNIKFRTKATNQKKRIGKKKN